MAKDLIVHAPAEIPFRKHPNSNAKLIGSEHVNAFWSTHSAKTISTKQGCYIFALRASQGYAPWYVGKATKSFRQEAFAIDKLNKYNGVLFDGRKGTPVMFFVAPAKNKNSVPALTCNEIETFLIQAAYAENPEIKNRQKTKIPDWTITGVVRPNRGSVSKTARGFKKMMGLK
jgi:hypothetical protein